MLRALLDLLVPPCCPICRQPVPASDTGLCDDCAPLLRRLILPAAPPLQTRCAAGWFHGPLREAIHRLKFDNEPWRGAALGRAAASLLPADDALDCIVAVPLSNARLRERGYNQAHLIARGVAGATGRPLRSGLLRRTRHDEAQSSKGRDARRDIRGAYTAAAVEGLRILLVDDVTTTGETAVACAEALIAGGADRVVAWSLAAAP